MEEKEERTMAMLCHLLVLSGLIIPFGNIIGPLVIWLIKKDESEFVNHHGKQALNFQILVTIASIVAAVLIFVLIGILLLPLVIIFSLVMTIIAALKANEGELYEYPLTIPIIK